MTVIVPTRGLAPVFAAMLTPLPFVPGPPNTVQALSPTMSPPAAEHCTDSHGLSAAIVEWPQPPVVVHPTDTDEAPVATTTVAVLVRVTAVPLPT